MNLKVRVALALVLLATLVSSVAASAKTPDVQVTNWSACVTNMSSDPSVSGPFELTVRASGVYLTDLTKGQLELEVAGPSTVQVSSTGVLNQKEPFEVVWYSTPSESVVGTYVATLHAYSHGKSSTDLMTPPTFSFSFDSNWGCVYSQ